MNIGRAALVLMAAALSAPPPPVLAAAWSQSERVSEPALRLRAAAQPVGGSEVEKELDLSDRNDTAIVEGTVKRGMPHRYVVAARKGQSFSAKLQSKEGARFDLYEPGASLTLLSSGYVVQGARVGNQSDGTQLETRLPRDGKYLLLLRPESEQASYSLELVVRDGGWFTGETWWREKNVWFAASFLAAGFFVVRLYRRKRNRRIFGR